MVVLRYATASQPFSTIFRYRDDILKICAKCGKEFPARAKINGIWRDLHKRKNCLECSPFGQQTGGRKKILDKGYGICLFCGKPLATRDQKKYCDTHCQHEYEYQEYIRKWKNGEVSGTVGKNWIDVSDYVRRYIFEKYNHQCAECGWARINPFTKTLPLEIEHIDGDSLNNKEENLTLLCPNCHSLTKTYRGANKGHGTRDIKWVARAGSTNVN